MASTITTVTIQFEEDVTRARQRARAVASALQFDVQDQTRIATAVSEVARYLMGASASVEVEFSVEGATAPQLLMMRIGEAGKTRGHRASRSKDPRSVQAVDPELALLCAQRLMDQCDRTTDAAGLETVWLKKMLPKRAPRYASRELAALEKQFANQPPANPIEEVQQQNQELARTLGELHERQIELQRLNRELEDTNRGVVALYAELDEKAGHLRRADEMKSSFLSEMTHEFRTPLNAILSLSRLLLDRSDGDLTSEQEKQVRYIRKSGEDLLETVNDLLDLAKIESGKIEVRPAECDVETLFSALRGMLRPLLVGESVELIFDVSQEVPVLWTDERKLSQILRNFLSNAIKFTERGQVRVSASLVNEGRSVAFAVADTGIGIPAEEHDRIFEEFTQVDNPVQARVKGTGLGLPLCRKLIGLLGGRIELTSAVGAGSTFTAIIPVRMHQELAEPIEASPPVAGTVPVLVVEDEPETRLLYATFLRGSPFRPVAAGSIAQAREILRREPIEAIVLDVLLPDTSAWQWLAELKAADATKHLPVLVASSVDDPRKALALGADAYAVKPIERAWLLNRLSTHTSVQSRPSYRLPLALVIDDQEADRYILTRMAGECGCAVVEAANGREGLRLARELHPDVVLLDWSMPELSGREVIECLRSEPSTSRIPVIVITSQAPDVTAWQDHRKPRAVLDKAGLSAAALGQVLDDMGIGHGDGTERRPTAPIVSECEPA